MDNQRPVKEIEELAEAAGAAVEAGDDAAALAALDELRGQLADLRAQVAALEQRLERCAAVEHEHDLPPGLRELGRDLAELESAEQGPEAVHHRYRRLL